MEPGEPIAIQCIQRLLQGATQRNLSSFHKAGIGGAAGVTLQEILDLKRSKNCSMKIRFSDAKILRELPYRKLGNYVMEMICLREFDNENIEEGWYHMNQKIQHITPPSRTEKKVVRLYMNFKKLVSDYRSLEFIRERVLEDYEEVCCSPDFAGTIDVHIKGHYELPGLIQVLDRSIGIEGIEKIEKVERGTCIVRGSNLEKVYALEGVTSATSDDVNEVADLLGIEAAREVIDNIISDPLTADIMTWSGKPVPFSKKSVEDPLLSMALERPRETIKNLMKNKPRYRSSIHSEIMLGLNPSVGTYGRDFSIEF